MSGSFASFFHVSRHIGNDLQTLLTMNNLLNVSWDALYNELVTFVYKKVKDRQTAEDIVQDQISSANPYAPLVVASLAKAAGIFHSTPKMVYVPASARLGEYATGFAGTVCLLEERPAGNEENNAAYGYSKKVVNSQKLLEKVFSNSDHQVNEKAFLKARLFDILIGDWDRHEDQWLWAAFEKMTRHSISLFREIVTRHFQKWMGSFRG